MNLSSSQRCGCPCRPQMQVPPCVNTNCGCEGTLTPPLRPMAPPPSSRPPMFPNQPSLPPQVPPMTGGAGTNNCGCGSSGPIRPGGELQQMPVGMGYVPWQRWGQTYPIEQGFSRGTIFPDLDLPFVMGRCR